MDNKVEVNYPADSTTLRFCRLIGARCPLLKDTDSTLRIKVLAGV